MNAPVDLSRFTSKRFSNAERAYTELFELLPDLARGKRPGSAAYGYVCDSDTLKAVAQHSENSVDALTGCMQSLGSVVHLAAVSGELDSQDMAHMGWLVKELSNLLEAVEFLRSNVTFELSERAMASATEGVK